jgi:cold shock CspA family protein
MFLRRPYILLRGFCSSSNKPKIHGIVKWFDRKKGYGFINANSDSGISEDIFVHQTNIVSATGFRSLSEKLPVAFICKRDISGRQQAYEVTLADGSPVKLEERIS